MKGDGILLDSCEALLKARALAKGRGARLRLVMTRRRRRHDAVEGANRFARGLYTEPVCQIEGLNSIIECGGAVVGTTGGVGESAGVDSWLRSIVVDIGGKGCIVGGLATSASPFAATTVAVALSMSGSVAARTAVRSTLLLLRLGSLLLLSELGVRRLALDSAQLVSLGITTPCSARGRTFLLIRERGGLGDAVRLKVLNLVRWRLTQNLSYNLHSGRELAEDDHGLDGSGKVETGVLEISEVGLNLSDRGSGMLSGGDIGAKELRELSISIADRWRSEVLLQVVPNLFGSPKVGDGGTDRRSKAKGDVAQSFFVLLVPVLSVVGRTSLLINGPLAVGSEIRLHGNMPLVPVGAGEDGDHLVEGAGHGVICCEQSQQRDATLIDEV